MDKKEHEYAQVLRWIADGESIICTYGRKDTAELMDNGVLLLKIGGKPPGLVRPEHFRLKPRTITINGHEVPEPMRVAPSDGTVYYMPDWSNPCLFTSTRWASDSYDRHRLAYGICHATREAAEAHAKALLSFTERAD